MKTTLQDQAPPRTDEDHPPVMGTWNRLYVLVLVIHVVFITLFYLITKSLS